MMGSVTPGPIDSLASIRIETEGGQPILQGTLLRTAVEALAGIPKLYPGVRVLESRLSPDRVEMLLDLGSSDEDIPRVVQSFKRHIHSLSAIEGPLWRRDHMEWLGADPAQRAALRASWPSLSIE